MNTVDLKFKQIVSSWFYSEPLLFSAVCTHKIIENPSLTIPMRCGNLRIEYSYDFFKELEDSVLEAYLKIEVFRILLLHPYSRQPYNAKKSILLMASDLTIARVHEIPEGVILTGVEYMKSRDPAFARAMETPGKRVFTYEDLTFEDWYKKLYDLISAAKNGQSAGSNENSGDKMLLLAEENAELWEENDEAQNKIQDEIQKAEIDQGWGGIEGELQRSIQDKADVSFDYRKALSRFRASIINASRRLTRMKPNRRFGFKAMGSRYERKANILIAVDVSGSITDESFNNFYHIIKNIFFLGIIEKIDVIFFDVNLKNTKPVTISRKVDLKDIKGRGGTNFQPALDFYFDHSTIYNGLIIFTDGEGNIPSVGNNKGNILWILDSRIAFEKNKNWISSLNGSQVTYIGI